MIRRSSAVILVAGLAGVLPILGVIGYLGDLPSLISTGPGYAAMSPVTAIALLLIAASSISLAIGRRSSASCLGLAAIVTSLAPLLSHLLFFDDLVSPLVARWLRSRIANPGRMSIGTSGSAIAIALSLLPFVRRRPNWPDALCGASMFVSGIALLGYAYGTLDLYGIAVFRTMSLQSASALFLLAVGALILHSENGWFGVLASRNEAGATTRRQLVFVLAGPVLGWIVLHAFRDDRLGVGASLAIFVAITTMPLIWLILRDGRLLNGLHALRRAQRESASAHTVDLQEQLNRQATQLKRQSAEQLNAIEEAKLNSDNRYRILFQSIDAGFCIVEMKFDATGKPVDYRLVETNAAFETQTDLKNPQGRWIRDLVPSLEEHWFEVYGEIALSRNPKRFENPAKALGDRWYDVHAFPVDDPALHRVGVLFNDITVQRRAAEALRQANETLEERVAAAVKEREFAQDALRQSQKMEAVGQLTGGLAHDFNNLLQGISGSLELLNARIAQGRFEDAERYVAAAQGASRRASALTHRLLAFSRRQTLAPKPTDVNRLVAGMEELIRRTVGPQVVIENVAAGGLWNSLVDQSQLENALLNLCINARDAMPNGGKLVIETGNKWLDERSARERDLAPGQYVTMCVSDNGCGMPAEVIARAFDPFFTTKPLGLGTGLGLSMIYGFAKQSGGQVRIYSEVGQGSMVCIWLPRHLGDAVEGEEPAEWQDPSGALRNETVLIVDDEPTVRMLIKDVLDEMGYISLEAGDGAAALKILQSDARIDLLITDVGLPGGMNGRQVADAARVARSDLTILFITGYAENAVLSHGHLPSGMHVLTKPFRMEALAGRVQELVAKETA